MRAKLTTFLAGEPNRHIGEEVDGADAVALCAAGFAVPIREVAKTETATAKVETEQADKPVRKSKPKPKSE